MAAGAAGARAGAAAAAAVVMTTAAIAIEIVTYIGHPSSEPRQKDNYYMPQNQFALRFSSFKI